LVDNTALLDKSQVTDTTVFNFTPSGSFLTSLPELQQAQSVPERHAQSAAVEPTSAAADLLLNNILVQSRQISNTRKRQRRSEIKETNKKNKPSRVTNVIVNTCNESTDNNEGSSFSILDSDELGFDEPVFVSKSADTRIIICISCGGGFFSHEAHSVNFDQNDSFWNPLRDHGNLVYCRAGYNAEQKTAGICYVKKGHMPDAAMKNGFDYGTVPECLLKLNHIERRCLSICVPMPLILTLPGGNQQGTKGHCVTFMNDVADTILSLPRPIERNGIIVMCD
jgi:hypothetical protein